MKPVRLDMILTSKIIRTGFRAEEKAGTGTSFGKCELFGSSSEWGRWD